jgi:hypothetical protein
MRVYSKFGFTVNPPMKILGVLALVLFTTTGCPTLGNMQSNASPPNVFTSSAPQPVTPFSARRSVTPSAFQPPNSGPQLIMPATGGAPIVGMPVGGNVYMPATGGPPVMGMP